MATVECAACHTKGNSHDMSFCSNCTLWVHFRCAGGDTGFAGFLANDAKCPNCNKKLSK